MLNHQDSAHAENPPVSHWLILGEFKLQAATLINGSLQTRLNEMLNQLELHAEFVNRLQKSTQETVTRLLHGATEIKLEHINLRVFVPSQRATQKKTWGFFSIEKREDIPEGAAPKELTIEIYLFIEGDAIPTHRNK